MDPFEPEPRRESSGNRMGQSLDFAFERLTMSCRPCPCRQYPSPCNVRNPYRRGR
jgi:hypothetical protein